MANTLPTGHSDTLQRTHCYLDLELQIVFFSTTTSIPYAAMIKVLFMAWPCEYTEVSRSAQKLENMKMSIAYWKSTNP